MARPTKLDDLRAKCIVDAVAKGLSLAGAARCGGICETTMTEWLSRGKDGEEPYAAFTARIRAAEGRVEAIVVSALVEQVKAGHVGAMCFWLERRRHRDWGKRETITHDHIDRRPEGEQDHESDLDLARSVVAALESRGTGTNG